LRLAALLLHARLAFVACEIRTPFAALKKSARSVHTEASRTGTRDVDLISQTDLDAGVITLRAFTNTLSHRLVYLGSSVINLVDVVRAAKSTGWGDVGRANTFTQ